MLLVKTNFSKIEFLTSNTGCLEVRNDKTEFTPNGFYFSAFGVQAQQPIHFVLNLTLFKEIVPEQSSWNLESVGKKILIENISNEKIRTSFCDYRKG